MSINLSLFILAQLEEKCNAAIKTNIKNKVKVLGVVKEEKGNFTNKKKRKKNKMQWKQKTVIHMNNSC